MSSVSFPKNVAVSGLQTSSVADDKNLPPYWGEEDETLPTFIQKNFLGGQGSVQKKKFLHDVLELGLSFHEGKKTRDKPSPPPESVSFSSPPRLDSPFSQTLSDFQKLAEHSTRFNSANFVGFPDSGNAVSSVAASIFAPLLNQNLINQDFCAPEATFIEMETVHWLRGLINFPLLGRYESAVEIGGSAVLGGVGANTTALLAAREQLDPGSLKNGLSLSPRDVKILVPQGISHYSIRTSLGWLGLGENAIVDVKTTQSFKLDLFDLEQVIEREKKAGHSVMAAVAYAGDSRTMSSDDFEQIADVLEKYKIWFHVDACHGMQLLFSHKYRSRVKGISRADSVTVDPHKTLWLPYTLSYVLFKNVNQLKSIASSSDLITKEKWSLGQTTPFIGSKAFNSLKLWSLMKSLGTARIGDLIDERIDLSLVVQDAVDAHPDFNLLNRTDINSTMFVWRGSTHHSADELRLINAAIKKEIQNIGNFYVHGFFIRCETPPAPYLPGETLYVLRIMNGNPLTTIVNLNKLLSEIKIIGKRLSLMYFNIKRTFLEDANKVKIFFQLADEASACFGDNLRDVVVYGSGAYKSKPLNSDLDIMVFLKKRKKHEEKLEQFSAALRKLHISHKLRIDEEVPYRNKLLIYPDDVALALQGRGFDHHNGKFVVPAVVKSDEFLGSPAIRYRLILNVFTSPNFCLCDSSFGFESEAAFELLVLGLWGEQAFEKSPKTLCDSLIGSGIRTGEMFLGYKENTQVRRRLMSLSHSFLSRKGEKSRAA